MSQNQRANMFCRTIQGKARWKIKWSKCNTGGSESFSMVCAVVLYPVISWGS